MLSQKKIAEGIFLIISLMLCCHGAFAQQSSGTLSGQVFDQLGGLIPKATITITNASGVQKTITANNQGGYLISDLPPGRYSIKATAPGFAVYVNETVKIEGGRRQQLDLTLTVAIENQDVRVAPGETLSTAPENNADRLVLRDKDLDMLPDDPEGLAAALQILAGSSAGPEGGQIIVDGFTGGRLPSKQSIREVRINQNTFSAEFDRVGFARIEIFTSAGTDKFRGQTYFNFNDESLNSRNPFALVRGPHQSRQYGGSISGPLRAKKLSLFVDLERREINDNAVINATILDSAFNVVPFNATILTPQRYTSFSPRLDYQLNTNHTFVARYSYSRSSFKNAGIGDLSLASRAYDTTSTDQLLQVSGTSVVSPRVANETRLQFIHSRRRQTEPNSEPALLVLDAFMGGGAQLGRASTDENRWELHNYTTFAWGNHTLRAGGRLRRVHISDVAPANFGGTFTFAGGTAPQLDGNNQIVRDSSGNHVLVPINSIERYRRTLLFQQQGLASEAIRVLGGGATQFSMAAGNPEAGVTRVDFGGFVQDDWRLRPNFTLNLGLRYETQTNIDSKLNFAPRISFAWSPERGTQKLKTVIRGAVGIFYSRFGENLTLQANRFDGINQQQFIVSPFVPQGIAILDLFPSAPTLATLATAGNATQTVRRVDAVLQSPYTIQSAFGIERQLPFGMVVAANFISARTLHLLRSRNINAPLPQLFDPQIPGSGVRPFSNLGNIYQYESDGVLDQNQLVITAGYRLLPKIVLSGTYALHKASSNTDGAQSFPVNQYDLTGEYGRSAIDIRHRFFLGGTINAPWGIGFNPFIVALSGQPFNITTGRDTNGDTLFTERPAFAANPTGVSVVNTQFGAFDLNPGLMQTLIPRNFGNGPAFFTVNLRITKAFSFGELPAATQPLAQPRSGAGSAASTPGSSGTRGSQTRPAEKRYRLTLSLQVQNLLNRTNGGIPIGNLSSPLFGQSISSTAGLRFSGGIGGNNSAAANRRVDLQVRLSF